MHTEIHTYIYYYYYLYINMHTGIFIDLGVQTLEHILIHRGSYMSGHFIWNLLNELVNFGILRALASKLQKLTNEYSYVET